MTPNSIILVPGFVETAKTMAPLGQTLDELGYSVTRFSFSRRIGKLGPKEARALQVLQMTNGADTPVVALGHSMGCLDIIEAAVREPGRFGHLILANPAGFIEPAPMRRLAGHFGAKALRDTPRQWRIGMSVIARNPMLAYREAHMAAGADVRADIRKLAEGGLRITVLASKDDILFDVSHLRRVADPPHDLIEFIEIKGYHDSIHLEPQRYKELLKRLLAAE